MRRLRHTLLAVAVGLCGLTDGAPAEPAVPKFRPEPFWPNPLPENWILGQVSGIATDRSDTIWIVHRPRTLLDDEKGAMKSPPATRCCKAAPAVLRFDAAGTLLASWGGPGEGFAWPNSEHGIHVDRDGNIWLAGNGREDGQILKFSPEGRFLMQIGKPGSTRVPRSRRSSAVPRTWSPTMMPASSMWRTAIRIAA